MRRYHHKLHVYDCPFQIAIFCLLKYSCIDIQAVFRELTKQLRKCGLNLKSVLNSFANQIGIFNLCSLPEPPEWTGPLTPNDKLTHAEHIYENKVKGPESIVYNEGMCIYLSSVLACCNQGIYHLI